MTTNNPPIAAWAPSSALAKLASRHNNAPCVLTDGPAEFNDVALIRLSDYIRLQAECEKLRQEVEALQGIQPEMPPMPPNGKGLPRYGVRWNGPTQPLSVPKDDGYWTPWHLAQTECEKLRKDAERYRHLRDRLTGPRFDNLFFLELYNAGCFDHPDDVDEAIDAAMQESTK